MLFNSLEFLLFFPVVVGLYFVLPTRVRWAWLLGTSYLFYMAWRIDYVVLLLISTAVDYVAGRRMGQLPTKRQRRPYLAASLLVNLSLLFGFKYFNFLNESMRALLGTAGFAYGIPALDVLLPVGISFYTFQTLSYSIDVYNGKTEPEAHLGRFALYVAFWPQLVAGPIERPGHLLPQFRQHFNFDYARVRAGLVRMAWGFFKKVAIADRLAAYVDDVYGAPGEFSGAGVLLATYFFAFQIYCDFSGYSDIAIGAARVMGFDLMENFRRPYTSRSIAEFWRRWHISLSTWFRDYVYIPLGGNRVVRWRWYYNLMITFVVSGLWHGAAWTFAIWGALHGGLLILGLTTSGWWQRPANGSAPRSRLLGWLQILATFHLVALGWIFFRAESVRDAFHFIGEIARLPWTLNWATGGLADLPLPRGPLDLAVSAALIALLLAVESWVRDGVIEGKLTAQPTPVRWASYVALLLGLLWFAVPTNQQFIYFQF